MGRTLLVVLLLAGFILGASSAEKITRHTQDGLPKHRPTWSPDGKRLAFARQEDGGLHIWQYVQDQGKAPVRLTNRKEPEYDAVFSPDGKTILLVTVTLSGTQGNLDLSSVAATGGDLKSVLVDGGKLAHQEWPAWSPDGKRVAFSSTHEGNQEIYTSRPDGGELVRVTQSPGTDSHPCWTPDGRSLIFSTDRWGGMELARSNPDGTGLVRLTKSPGLDDYPAVSPDGKTLAFVTNRDGQFEIYLSNLDGTNPRNLSQHPGRDTFPSWTPDGKGVTFVSGRASEADIFTIELSR